jgi:hypothetical protein
MKYIMHCGSGSEWFVKFSKDCVNLGRTFFPRTGEVRRFNACHALF